MKELVKDIILLGGALGLMSLCGCQTVIEAEKNPEQVVMIDGKTVIASIEKAEHTPVTVEGVAPNCSTVGVSDSVKCSVCGEHISGGELLPTNDTHISSNLTIINNPTKYVVVNDA